MESSSPSKGARRRMLTSAAGATLAGLALPSSSAGGASKDATAPSVSVLDFIAPDQHSAIADGSARQDCAPFIVAALASGAKVVRLPAGRYPIGSPITVPPHVTLFGDGYGVAPGQGATILRKTGSFTAVILQTGSQLHDLSVEGTPGNQGDGVLVVGGRSMLRDVGVFGQGRDGVKVGDVSPSAANTNLWRINNVISRANKRHGLFISHEGKGLLPDANAGIVTAFESSYNAGDGVRLAETVDNQLLGLALQGNGGAGLRMDRFARGNVALAPYTENNAGGDVVLEVGADRNMILGFRSGVNNSSTLNRGAENIVWGRFASISGVPLHESPEAFEDLQILDRSAGGVWRMRKQPGTRYLSIELANSGKGADVLIQSAGAGSSGVRFSTDTHSAALRDVRARGTVNLQFGRMAPQSTADVGVMLSGVDAGCVIHATPVFAIPPGITWCAYWDPSAGATKVRCTNSGPETVAVSGPFQVVALRAS